MLMPFDHVRYTGDKQELRDELKNKVGEILARVEGRQDEAYTVEFGSEAYVIKGENLVRHTFKEKEGVAVERIVRKWEKSSNE